MSKAYRAIVAVADRFVPSKLRPLWEHDAGKLTRVAARPRSQATATEYCAADANTSVSFAGPKTIFFWAPAFKWVNIKKNTLRGQYSLRGPDACRNNLIILN